MDLKTIQREQIKNFLLENPDKVDRSNSFPYLETAKIFGVDQEEIRSIWRQLRRRGLVEIDIEPSVDYFKSNENTAELTKVTSKKVKTLDDLIDACDIDTDLWEVTEWSCKVCNYGKKQLSDKDTSYTNYSINAKLKRKKLQTDLPKQKEIILEELKKDFKVNFSPISYENKDGLLLEICIFDAHFGKLSHNEESGGDYDLKIAGARFTNAIEDLLSKVDLTNVSRIVFPLGNDLYNVDNLLKTTTSGTPQDTDGRFHKMFKYVKNIVINSIERLAKIAPVDVLIVPGNHDEATCFLLGEVLDAYFSGYTNISVNNSPKLRKYYKFGECSFMYTHGDKEKISDLGMIFATEEPLLWGTTSKRFVKIGHFHHNKKMTHIVADEFQGYQLQVIPSISENDKWHYSKGFLSQRQAKAFIYNDNEGLVAELTHNVKN